MNGIFWGKLARQWAVISGVQTNHLGNTDEVINHIYKVSQERNRLVNEIEEEDDDLLMIGEGELW
nr:hypothetical protein [Lysinibacillus timonensis]